MFGMVSLPFLPKSLFHDSVTFHNFVFFLLIGSGFPGERTPVGVRLVDSPANIPEHWNMCKTAHRFSSAVSSVLSNSQPEFEDPLPAKKVVERRDGKAVVGEW